VNPATASNAKNAQCVTQTLAREKVGQSLATH